MERGEVTLVSTLPEMLERNAIPRRRLLGMRYHVVANIGKGMFSEAFLVEDRHSGGSLAVVKSSRMAHGDTFDMNRERQLRLAISEARIMTMFNDDGVVRLFDFWCEDESESICFLMEYCSGGDLETYLRTWYPLSERLLLLFFLQCLLSVAHVHTKGIVHRDLKPANILIARSDADNVIPTLKLADFGLSTTNNVGTAAEGLSIVGTPLYMSPEVVQRGVCAFGSDVWSLGVVFYRLITNEQPFNEENQEALYLSIVNTQPVHPCSVAKHHYPRELGDLVMVMLEKDVDRRPTARHLIALSIFEKVLQQSPWRSRPLRGTFCLFVCRPNRAIDIFTEPHSASQIVATVGFGEHVFVTNEVRVHTVLQQCAVTGKVVRIFTWDPPQANNSGHDGSGARGVTTDSNTCLHNPSTHPYHHGPKKTGATEASGHCVRMWYRVVGPYEGYCAPYERGYPLLWSVRSHVPCSPLPASVRVVGPIQPTATSATLPQLACPTTPEKKTVRSVGKIITSLFSAGG